jgi:hypothetical protein
MTDTEHTPTRLTPGVRLAPPPPALMRVINPIIRRLLASRRHGRVAVLHFTGRRTGRPVTVPVGLHVIDGVATVFTSSRWRHNFTGGAPVTISYRGRTSDGCGVLQPSAPEHVGAALRQALDKGASPFLLGLKIAKSHQPTATELGTLGVSSIALDLHSDDS